MACNRRNLRTAPYLLNSRWGFLFYILTKLIKLYKHLIATNKGHLWTDIEKMIPENIVSKIKELSKSEDIKLEWENLFQYTEEERNKWWKKVLEKKKQKINNGTL